MNEVDLESVTEAALSLPPPIEGSTEPIAVISNQSFVWKDISSKYASRHLSLKI